MDEFYVGYLPESPPEQGRFTRKVTVLFVAVPLVLALALVIFQRPLADAWFEWGQYRELSGVIVEKPYPMLAVTRPGETGARETSLYYLVAPGKQGADQQFRGMDGKTVTLKGSLLYRDDRVMVEVVPNSVVSGQQGRTPHRQSLGTATLTGEIIDSKCGLGAMNPGEFKVHKACAIRCINGGIPPILLIHDGDQRRRYVLLTGKDGRALNSELDHLIAEPVSVNGRLEKIGDNLVLAAEPADMHLLDQAP